MGKQQPSFFSHKHGTLLRKLITIRQFQILMIRRCTGTIIPYPLKAFCGIRRSGEFVGDDVVLGKAMSCWLTTLVDNCTGNIQLQGVIGDRKSTRLNSSHVKISYAVFFLKKKSYI